MNWNDSMIFKGHRNDLSTSLENATQINCCPIRHHLTSIVYLMIIKEIE